MLYPSKSEMRPASTRSARAMLCPNHAPPEPRSARTTLRLSESKIHPFSKPLALAYQVIIPCSLSAKQRLKQHSYMLHGKYLSASKKQKRYTFSAQKIKEPYFIFGKWIQYIFIRPFPQFNQIRLIDECID